MRRTLLVALNVSAGESLTELASDIQEDLVRAGHDVDSVRPWGSPLDQLTPAVATTSPTLLSSEEPTTPQET
jgi:hypothetical protein